MARAAVLIGVNRTGKLPALADAVEGAKRMEAWALAAPQSMKRDHVLLLTDEAAPLEIAAIRRAIRKLVDAGTIDQLIVYFAGHGVNIRYNELWLLSDAPEDPSAAVNLDGSVTLARSCGIPHVVFISDACRTSAEGLQAQGVTGGEIFPNNPVPGAEASIDIFFGTTLGRPALEVKSPEVSSGKFEAVYTSTLIDAFRGKFPAALKLEEVQGRLTHVLQPRPLKACLSREVPKRLASLLASTEVNQVPDARITSDDGAWLVRFDEMIEVPVNRSGMDLGSPRTPPVNESLDASLAAEALLLDGATVSRPKTRGPGLERIEAPRPICSFETRCGFEVSGTTLREAISSGARVEVIQPERTRVRVAMDAAPATVLLVFEDGSSALLPALRDQVARVRIDPDEGIVDVSYEPTGNGGRWPSFAPSAEDLRSLRARVAEAARENSLHMNKLLADRLPTRLRYAGHLDPSLALYVAYALHDAGLTRQLQALAADARHDIGRAFLDLDLLARAPLEASVLRTPMLSRGWSMLRAFGVPESPEIDGLRQALRESLWTHFTEDGTRQLKQLISTRRL
jgi:hypothetical protein